MSHNNGLYYGQRILVLSIVDRKTGNAFPIDFRVCQKGPSRKQEISALDLAIEILRDIEAVGFPKALIAADSWFNSAPFMEKLHHLKWRFVIELKSNRLVYFTHQRTIDIRPGGVTRHRIGSKRRIYFTRLKTLQMIFHNRLIQMGYLITKG